MKEFGKRFVTGVIGILLLIFIILKGEIYLGVSVLILSFIGLSEFYSAIKKTSLNPVNIIGYIGTIGLFLPNIFPRITKEFLLVLIIISLLIILMLKRSITITDISVTLLGILYIPFLLSHILYLDGSLYIWLIFIIAFGTDTFAYIFGNLFGKNKLSPNISPNKTIEGSIGGILGSLISSLVYAFMMNIDSKWSIIILSILVSMISQIGDLVASKIKRMVEIKDYGYIFPGHGGVLDRFDSIILSAPVVYYFVEYFLI